MVTMIKMSRCGCDNDEDDEDDEEESSSPLLARVYVADAGAPAPVFVAADCCLLSAAAAVSRPGW